jgi:hypothetical protein
MSSRRGDIPAVSFTCIGEISATALYDCVHGAGKATIMSVWLMAHYVFSELN